MVKSKKGVSEIIGYVLLLAFGVVMAIIAYNYLKTFVPKEGVDCPEGVSIFITDYSCENNWLNITIKNNGKFNYDGYYIHAANTTKQRIATINIVPYFRLSSSGNSSIIENSYILFNSKNITENFSPKQEDTHYFLLPYNVEVIELTPIRFQKEGNTIRTVSCGKSLIREEIEC